MARFLLIFLAILSSSAYALDGNGILKQVDRNLAPPSYEMYRKLVNIEPDGSRKEYVMFTAKKGRDRMVSLFLSPPTEEGRTTLRQGDNMWMYIPDVGRPLRITSLQSVVGGIFNNSDLMRLEYSVEYKVTSARESGGEYLLDLKAKTSSVAYDRLKMWVDKRRVLPTKIEAYAASGLLIKTLRYRDIRSFGGGITRPATLQTDSPLHKGYKSVMKFAKINARNFRDEVFTLNYMQRVKELR
jgi:outer membrane lipoprotein-sorting protein